MLSIVGNIKINDPLRLKYLIACLRSYKFINDCQLLLNVDCDMLTYNEILKEIHHVGFKNFELSNLTGNYGEIYCGMLDKVNSNFVLNFFEDHFMVCDDRIKIGLLIESMVNNKVDVCKCSFFYVEQNSLGLLIGNNRDHGFDFVNDQSNHSRYQAPYGSRYFVGVNFITTLSFAKRFWSRKFNSNTPHSWEISRYDKQFEHTAIIPHFPIMESIDDDHGHPNSCLLKTPINKFLNIYNSITEEIVN